MLKLLGSLWGLFEGSVHAGLSRAEANPPFWQNSEMKDLFHLIIMNIKIPKPPHKSFLKIIGLGHFLQFLGSSDRYYL